MSDPKPTTEQFLVDTKKLRDLIEELVETEEPDEREIVPVDPLLARLSSCRVPLLHPDKIRGMIEWFSDSAFDQTYTDLLRFILGEKQDTWTAEDFGLPPGRRR